MISAGAKRFYSMAAVVSVGMLLLALALVGPVLSSSEDFCIYNSGWNGTSELASRAYRFGNLVPTLKISATDSNLDVIHVGISDLDLVPEDTSLIVIGPATPFSEPDGLAVGEFVRAGGRLLLADDFGTGNSLLEGMNATSRFSGRLLMDLAFQKQPEFSVCFDIEKGLNVTAGVNTLLLNYPTAIIAGANTTVLARSSIASFLDVDGNHLRNWTEPKGPFPIIAVEKLGQGEIMLLSDPSMIINGMLDQADNGELADNLMYWSSQGVQKAYFDESHRNYFDPVTISLRLFGGINDAGRIAVIAMVLLALTTILTEYPKRFMLALWRALKSALGRISYLMTGRRRGTGEELPTNREDLLAETLRRHPEWRPGRLRMLLDEMERHSKTKGW